MTLLPAFTFGPIARSKCKSSRASYCCSSPGWVGGIFWHHDEWRWGVDLHWYSTHHTDREVWSGRTRRVKSRPIMLYHRLVNLLLCLMMIAPDRFLQQKVFQHATVELLRTGVSEMTMLMVVFLQSYQTDQVIETVRSILGMQVPISKRSLRQADCAQNKARCPTNSSYARVFQGYFIKSMIWHRNQRLPTTFPIRG